MNWKRMRALSTGLKTPTHVDPREETMRLLRIAVEGVAVQRTTEYNRGVTEWHVRVLRPFIKGRRFHLHVTAALNFFRMLPRS